MNTRSHYDVAIIGAGMSGLAAGIRLAHFGKRVCIFERHNAPGGLNGFYSIAGRKFDVGLHAMTNFVRPGVKGTPLTKLLRQLRIAREEFALCEQKQSRIAFGPRGEQSLRFTNDFAVLESEVAQNFPAQIDGFRRLVALVRAYDDVSLDAKPESARAVVRQHLTDPLLEDMVFCPVMYYGSATEHDMEFGQFVIMFKAVYLEGFARPFEGVRLVIRVLLEKYRAAGGERRMKCGVEKILTRADRATALVLDSGEEITADHILSSIGAPETEALLAESGERRAESLEPKNGSANTAVSGGRSQLSALNPQPPDLKLNTSNFRLAGQPAPPPGRLSFVETITVLDRQPADFGWGDDTIIFFNDSAHFQYGCPAAPVDLRSGVICLPNNFDFGPSRTLPEGLLRVTCLANPAAWLAAMPPTPRSTPVVGPPLAGVPSRLSRPLRDGTATSAGPTIPPLPTIGMNEIAYQAAKQHWFQQVQTSARRFLPPVTDESFASALVTTDMFTPRTIARYTGHLNGAIYGAPEKIRDGRTALANVYLCGTDQGFLGIVGAMLSGISMANYHVLQGS
ncbi:MAG: hypothetical protein RLZZ15_1909 [Verrucomicrobiota bacterium]